MKPLLTCLAAALLLSTVNSAQAVETFLKATVTGTVQTQIALGPADGRVHTAILNEKRILEEFGVSKEDYVLVFGTSSGLVLLPKHAAAILPTLTIFEFGTSSVIIDTKARAFKLQAAITPGSATNLFKDLAGEIAGTAGYKGPYPPSVFSKLAFTVTARGTDTSGGNGAALLKFKVTTAAPFVQQ